MKVFSIPSTTLLFTLLTAARVAAVELPEPEVIFYGQVCANDGRVDCVLHAGTLSWTIQPPTGAPIVVTTELDNYPNEMSYVLKIPAAKLVEGSTISANKLEASGSNQNHDRSTVKVDGETYQIAFPFQSTKNTLVYGELLRGKVERVDLALIADLDSDGDLMPDVFEDFYAADGLQKNVKDADGDIDKDGKSNLQEFQEDTDPNGFDYDTWAALPSTGLAPSERGRTFDKEGDRMSNFWEFAIGGAASQPDAPHQDQVLVGSYIDVGGTEHLSLTFTKPSARRLGVTYAIEASDGLDQWDGQVVVMEDSKARLDVRTSTANPRRQFMRLRAIEE